MSFGDRRPGGDNSDAQPGSSQSGSGQPTQGDADRIFAERPAQQPPWRPMQIDTNDDDFNFGDEDENFVDDDEYESDVVKDDMPPRKINWGFVLFVGVLLLLIGLIVFLLNQQEGTSVQPQAVAATLVEETVKQSASWTPSLVPTSGPNVQEGYLTQTAEAMTGGEKIAATATQVAEIMGTQSQGTVQAQVSATLAAMTAVAQLTAPNQCKLYPDGPQDKNVTIWLAPGGERVGELTQKDLYPLGIQALEVSGRWIRIHISNAFSTSADRVIGDIDGWVVNTGIRCDVTGLENVTIQSTPFGEEQKPAATPFGQIAIPTQEVRSTPFGE